MRDVFQIFWKQSLKISTAPHLQWLTCTGPAPLWTSAATQKILKNKKLTNKQKTTQERGEGGLKKSMFPLVRYRFIRCIFKLEGRMATCGKFCARENFSDIRYGDDALLYSSSWYDLAYSLAALHAELRRVRLPLNTARTISLQHDL